MIVPANRLLVFAALVLPPSALLPALTPALAPVAWAVALGAALIAALDAAWSLRDGNALRAGFGAEGFQPGANTPFPVFNFTRDRAAQIVLKLANDGVAPRAIRIGLSLPESIAAEHETHSLVLPPRGVDSYFAWPCTATERGRFTLDAIYMETPSRLGFWSLRARHEARAEIRVFPNLAAEYRRLAGIFLNRGNVGIHAQRRVGRGRDFEQLREYLPGDSFEDIHWKATARRARPATKMYQVERTQEVYALIDASRPSGRKDAATGDSHLERAIEAALVLSQVAERQGDHFGLAAYTDAPLRFVRAGHGKGHYQACRDALYTLTPGNANPDYAEIFTWLRMRLRRRALLLFLTYLDDPLLADQFAAQIPILARRHLVLAETVTAPSIQPVFSAPAASVDEIYAHIAGHQQWNETRELQKRLRRENVTLRMAAHPELTPSLVAQYINVKQRQLL